MNRENSKITAALASGAEYLVMGEISAHTGLLVSQAPRNNSNFDIIVNNHDLSNGCRVEVKHSRTGFKANISGGDYDFLVFVYAPSEIEQNSIKATAPRKIYVFPKSIIEQCPKGSTGTNFNPKHIKNYEDYESAFNLIASTVLKTPNNALKSLVSLAGTGEAGPLA